MSKTKKILIGSLVGFLTIVVTVSLFGFWFISAIKKDTIFTKGIESTLSSDHSYLTSDSIAYRGKILAVVTSQATMGQSGKPTGYEFSELARAYYVFLANGFDVDVASPKGGAAPIVMDDNDMGTYDYAFLNDPVAQSKIKATIEIEKVKPEEYQALYFVGGKGAMFDFPKNLSLQKLIAQYVESGKVIGAVCHGPAALVNVTLSNGNHLLKGKKISSFTNKEELFLIPNALEIFPFMLQDKLIEQGATFQEGIMYLENVAIDGKLVTGQNPWSTWLVAESMIKQLGYTPKSRETTPEENAILVLKAYETDGYTSAIEQVDMLIQKGKHVQRGVIAVHGIVAAMNFELGKVINLVRLISHLN